MSPPPPAIRAVRFVSLAAGLSNAVLVAMGALLVFSSSPGCPASVLSAFVALAVVAAVRISYMVAAARAQRDTAMAIVGEAISRSDDANPSVRQERRRKYRRWLWWTRFGMMITVLQFVVAIYLVCVFAKDLSSNNTGNHCFVGKDADASAWVHTLLISFLILVWFAVAIQCSTGSDVLRWRSFYATHDVAWRTHYREVFDHGIREVFCCLGRAKYLSVTEEDEVYCVAKLLGDLVAYRASGTGHLELLAGLALLQKYKRSSTLYNGPEAPEMSLHEALFLHQYAEAAYTGPLLDFGRNPVFFPCAWLYRQGILAPWSRNRRPVIDGDNWWRGHAAAFLKYVNIPPEALRQGRASQTKREAAYFVVVLHDIRTVVITVRGTETPEDIITDGLCSDCTLSMDDLDGLINGQLPQQVKDGILSSFPHYGHSGIVEYARNLFMKIDGQPDSLEDSLSCTPGFLSSLMGRGCECDGYKLRIVGHSLGGAVATLLGIRLYGRYPNLHVFTYGSLPCVDSVIAEACSDFVTSIIYNDEFSSRLSIKSVLRLRAAAVGALATDPSADSALITKLVRRILQTKKNNENTVMPLESSPPLGQITQVVEDGSHSFIRSQLKGGAEGGALLYGNAISCMTNTDSCSNISHQHKTHNVEESSVAFSIDLSAHKFTGESSQLEQNPYHHEASCLRNLNDEPFGDRLDGHDSACILENGSYNHGASTSFQNIADLMSIENQISRFGDKSLSSNFASERKFTELYLPGLVIHIVHVQKNNSTLWKSWRASDSEPEYKAYLANRESFMDILVSPYMFLDHMPWRCHFAIKKVLSHMAKSQQSNNVLHEEIMV